MTSIINDITQMENPTNLITPKLIGISLLILIILVVIKDE